MQSIESRLLHFPRKHLPLRAPLRISWNAHLVPWIEAQTDHDLAFALGLVHAHLRGGQLALAKRIAYGRLAEIAGPWAVDLDHTLRIIGLDRAARACERELAPDTRAWLQAFVDGLNLYQNPVGSRRPRQPREFAWAGLDWEPWTLADVLTLGRLAGADIG